ncbi:spore coat protein [Clostridium felsineum]|uniref:Uncharacterized protein n=1 Tax=Clostridium felsineum TaxID=36839 RepID=A0A1S8KXP9_9CLOT|nr:spore coat protein [Clostridium felsineum]URZ07988.1 hypothetical protein CLROS_033540 [Clostridium felsineum]URZ13019.1 hypothetical protein CROST_037690 [Clostridium felsineum]
MSSIKDTSFIDYIRKKGINICNTVHVMNKNYIDEKKIIEQIHIIGEFHKIARDYNGFDVKNIKNKIGKLVGQYKIQEKNLKKYAAIKEKSNELTMFDEYFLSTYKGVIKRCEKCLNYISDDKYIQIIKRGMRNNDICLGNCYFDNLWKDKELCIVDYSDVAFNMVEIDGIKFLNKLKINNFDFDFELLIDEYILTEGIERESENFMKALISFPVEYIKCVERYQRNTDKDLEDKFTAKLNKAIRKDGESII